MNRLGYSFLLYLLSPLILCYLAFRGIKSPDYRQRWSERFGFKKLQKTDLHIHSVSMGETLAAVPLIRGVLAENSALTVTITTTSPTGSAEVKKAFKNELQNGRVQHCYLPFDISFCIKRFLKQVSPRHCIIMETELWPNLIHYANKKNIKVMLANGRLSQKSAAQYHKWKYISFPMLQKLSAIAVQTLIEAKRFEMLGVDPQKLHICGNLKFDLTISEQTKAKGIALREKWQKLNSPIWIAGSVHPGEFESIILAHKALLIHSPNALFIMIPRHPEQFKTAGDKLTSMGMNFIRLSDGESVSSEIQVVLGDTMGELLTLYGAADQAFIGGTLVKNGGHNPLEPAAMGLPVYSGPHYWNFDEITGLLKDAGNLKVVNDDAQLALQLIAQFDDQNEWQISHKAGLKVVENNRGALQKQLTLAFDLINS